MRKLTKRIKRQIGRRLLVATLSTAMLLGSSMTVFAAEPQNTEPIDVAMVSPTDEAVTEMVDINGAKVNSKVADQVAGLVESAEASAMAEDPNAAAVSAETVAELADVYATPRSVSGFGYTDTVGTINTFYVPVSGSYSSSAHITIKTEHASTSTTESYFSIFRPDGTAIKTDVKLTGNNEKQFSFSNAPTGNYKVIVTVIPGTVSVRADCWVW